MKQLASVLHLVVASFWIFSYPGNQAQGKLSRIFAPSSHYDKRVRPMRSSGSAVNVSVALMLVAFGPVNKKKFTVESDFFLKLRWSDPRLAMQSNSTVKINAHPSDWLWIPDVYFLNSRKMETHQLLAPSSRITVETSGALHVSARVTAVFSCLMDFHLYPLDTQHCLMQIESYAFPEEDLILLWDTQFPYEVMTGALKVPGYTIGNIRAAKSEVKYREEPYSRLSLHFCLTRLPSYFLYHIYIPTALLVIASWGTFWLPVDAIPARVTMIVTPFLATVFILQGASDEITKVSYNTALEIYQCGSFLFIVATMVEYLIVLHVTKIKEEQMAQRTNAIDHRSSADGQECATTKEIQGIDFKLVSGGKSTGVHSLPFRWPLGFHSIHVDDFAKLFFPFCYMIFVCVYTSHYMIQSSASADSCTNGSM